jgi:hypothetical protein
MQTNVLIILIIAAAIIILVTLFLNRGRLKRLGIKVGKKGFEVDAQMIKNNEASKPKNSSATKSKAKIKGIKQKGDRDDIHIAAKDVKASDIEQNGNDNKINIGK